MFAQLVEDIRGLVISRVFAYQPRPVEITPVETAGADAGTSTTTTQTDQTESSKKKKRRRH